MGYSSVAERAGGCGSRCVAIGRSDRQRDRYPDGFDAVLDLVNYAPDVPASLVKDGGRVASTTGQWGDGRLTVGSARAALESSIRRFT
jgi:hypothetical protein